ncbi:MAG: radical SAM protein, partial [Pseudomonadota bacterium]
MNDQTPIAPAADVADAVLPAGRAFNGADRRAPLRDGLTAAGEFHARQTAGRFYPIACVALETTQRCNLDCSLCYLSDAAEMAFDVPVPVLKRRIDTIHSHYGPGTSVQITGGDPTLRKTADIAALCRHIAGHGMRSCLMTNGIKATREMLTELAAAGLDDVAFHVDLTQERKGYPTEASLNAVRAEYIARARGLGLRVLFNTTVYEDNLAEIPTIVRFFRDHA